jgi:hypothetical protein
MRCRRTQTNQLLAALFLAGITLPARADNPIAKAGDYVVGTYVPGVYGGPYYGPYYGGYGPYNGGEFIVGGYHYHHYYGGHHFYGYGFGARHFGGGFHR